MAGTIIFISTAFLAMGFITGFMFGTIMNIDRRVKNETDN